MIGGKRKMTLRFVQHALVAAFVAMAMAVSTQAVQAADEGIHKLALQISDNDPAKMTTVLNVAANVSRYYTGKGEEIEIEIIAFNAGLHMLREDTSPVKDRIKVFSESMPNVVFDACNNTIQGMTKKEGKEPVLVSAAEIVPAGVVRLMELNDAGWTVVRP
jgi:intracellular sulfur oxidation DsrE/DsrF family protein